MISPSVVRASCSTTLVDVPAIAGAAWIWGQEVALGTRSFGGLTVLLEDPGDLNFAGFAV